MYYNGQKEMQNSPAGWPRLLGNFVDLPGASRIEILPDIEAFNEPGADDAGYDVESVCRWESEGGKIMRSSMPPRGAVSAFGTDPEFRQLGKGRSFKNVEKGKDRSVHCPGTKQSKRRFARCSPP